MLAVSASAANLPKAAVTGALPKAAEIAAALEKVTLDAAQTYHVRDLQLSRGDIKLYLTDGILSIVTPVNGRVFAAVFTTAGTDTGDAEVLVFPPQRSERASLASFIQAPNLDEHFTSALFLFSDDTATDLLTQIQKGELRKAPEFARDSASKLNPAVQEIVSQVDVRLVESLLDNHATPEGFFYSLIVGRQVQNFDVLYDPTDFEPVSVGRFAVGGNGKQDFQLWTSFRPRHAPPFVPPPVRIADYRIDASIRPDLSMAASVHFQLTAAPSDGRVLSFAMSERLKVISASVDGKSAEIFQRDAAQGVQVTTPATFLVISDAPLAAGTPHSIEIRYEGSVIRQTENGSYAVDERNTWYPSRGTILTNFDLTFRCPERLRLVSTGELVSEEVANGERVVHRKTQIPEHLAGFNLGEYGLLSEDRGPYRVECFSNAAALHEDPRQVLNDTGNILEDYTRRWMQLPIHSVAVSPVPAYFGQGFPGLIYLSTISYLHPEDRPAQLRNPRTDTFFSEMLLPHEVAHQWWGNLVVPADYRTTWLMEAMANYSALQFLERQKGAAALEAVLAQYREDLLHEQNGKTLESAGPVDFGSRLLDNSGMLTWHIILYEKGTWILHMLRQRLGDAAFNRMQVRLLQQFATGPLSNEDFRKLASDFVPAGQPDKSLSVFFDAWIYGTGIPKMKLHGESLELSGVDEDFSVDVPLRCRAKGGQERTEWVRGTAGSNDLEASGCVLPTPEVFLYSIP